MHKIVFNTDYQGFSAFSFRHYLDQTQSRIILAEAIREAYSDLFNINKKAYELSIKEVKNKLKTLTHGKKSEKVIGLMAGTFKKLCELADWSKPREGHQEKAHTKVEEPIHEKGHVKAEGLIHEKIEIEKKIDEDKKNIELHYNIQIHLPDSRDAAVFDAIFRSLKEHLY
ncbi:MAG: DUF5343 domain-containing protein [Nitrospirae bacterium]|nr:DUF5343 domain-containing protein [Nitrospirota bacterium]